LILKAIGDKEGIEVTDEDVDAALAERAEAMDVSTDYLKDQLETGKMMDEFRASVLQDKIYKFIKDNAEITEEPAPPEKAEHETESE
jgi:trigger factor